MASTATFTCLCGVQKKASNHWILATQHGATIRFSAWDWDLALSDNVVILCGERCAAALLSRSLGEWKHESLARAGVLFAAA